MFVRIILLITDVTGNNDCSASNSSASFCFLFCCCVLVTVLQMTTSTGKRPAIRRMTSRTYTRSKLQHSVPVVTSRPSSSVAIARRSTVVDIANSITAAVRRKLKDSSFTMHYTSVINNNFWFRGATFPLLDHVLT